MYPPSGHDEPQSLHVAVISGPQSGCHAVLIRRVQVLPRRLLQQVQAAVPGRPVVPVIHGAPSVRPARSHSVWTPPPSPPALSVDAPVGARCSPQGRRSALALSRDVCTVTGGEAVLLVAEGGNTVRGGGPPDLLITPAQISCELRRPRRIIACARTRIITC